MVQGLPTTKGYALGLALIKRDAVCTRETAKNCDPEEEKYRFQASVEASREQIQKISENLAATGEKNGAEILESQLSYLSDPDVIDETLHTIMKGGISAENAVLGVTGALADEFDSMDDEYIRERAADIRDIGERIARNLSGGGQLDLSALPAGTVLVARDLKPSETALIDPSKIAAFVTETGGVTCHTAIMARARGMIAVVGAEGALSEIHDGDYVAVDGNSGSVIVNPDKELKERYRRKIHEQDEHKRMALELCSRPIIGKTGKRIGVFANIGSADEVAPALSNGAEGIGLFRTELVYMGRDDLPDEEEQLSLYRKIAEKMEGRPVIIRTIDIGGDKDVPALHMEREDNPFLGLRAIRLCLLKDPDLFKTQLRALLRAAVYGDIRIMFPMISNVQEFEQAKEILLGCEKELDEEGIAYKKDIPVGMMVEVPSAAVLADEFAGRADFFSIGTNDLTQYTLAVDRMNKSVSPLYDSMDPAVLRLIENTASAAHKHGIACGVCGELAANPEATEFLLDCGIDELSMSAASIPDIKLNIMKVMEESDRCSGGGK